MSRIPTLVRAGLKSNFGLSLFRYRVVKQKRDLWLIPVFGLAGLALAPMFYGLVLLLRNLYIALHTIGQESLMPALGVLAGQLFILLFGLYYVISAFYFSRDLEMLIPLPLKPFEVMFSKFAVILVNEYLTVMAVVVPVLAVFGASSAAGPAYWINAVLIYLFLPVIPLAVVSAFVVAMMRLVNLSRKKDILIIVGSIILITAALSVQFAATRAGNRELNAETVAGYLASPDSLIHRLGSGFPPSIWAAKALTGGFSRSGLWNLFLFTGVSLALFAAILGLSERLFYRGLVGLGEVSGRRRALSAAQLSGRVSSGRHPVRAIFAREWTPIFLLNGTLTVILVPVLLVLLTTAGSGRGDAAALLRFMTSTHSFTAVLAAAVFMTVCGSLNGTSSSTFSREGRHFWISQVIPVAPRDQVAAKFLHSYLVALLGVAAGTAVCVFAFHLGPGVLAPAIVLALAGAVPLVAAGMIIDLARPLLDWTNPQKAIKQNLNVLLAMAADVGILTVLYFTVKLLLKAGLSGMTALAVLFTIVLAMGVAAWRFLVGFAGRRYRDIEG